MRNMALVVFLCSLLCGCGIVSELLGSPDNADAAGVPLIGIGGAVAASGNPVAWIVGSVLSALGYGLTGYAAWRRQADGTQKK